MVDYKGFLDTSQWTVILFRHRREKDACFADRLKTILILDKGYSFEQIAKILFRDDQTIRNYFAKFEDGGIEGLLSDKYTGYSGCLTEDEKRKLTAHLEGHTYLDINPI